MGRPRSTDGESDSLSESEQRLLDALAKIRATRSVSARKFSELAGVSAAYMSEILNGKKVPTPSIVENIARSARLDETQIAALMKLAAQAKEQRRERQRTRTDERPVASTSVVLAASRIHRERMSAQEVDYDVPRPDVVDAVIRELAVRAGHPEPQMGRVVPIRGAPGAGKTVIAGQIFDALADAANVVVVPCEQVLATPRDAGGFDKTFGALVQSQSGLVGPVGRLRRVDEHVVVLFDAVDCVLDEHTRAPLIEFLAQLQRIGADIVFTCRRHDLNVLLQPVRQLGVLAPYSAQPVDVPPLSRAQIIAVTVGFLAHRGIEPPGGAAAFAEQVLELGANGTSLAEVVANPLLLIMMCDLFARTGSVPPDLTTSRLCSRYCRERIDASRKYPDDRELAAAKLSLWRRMSRRLWQDCDDRIALSTSRSALIDGPPSQRAFDDLSSEGVIVPKSIDGGRVGFLHQVIAEYSIAIHLRDEARAELATLLDDLRARPLDRWYAWQIVRHLIALAVDERDARDLLDRLDLSVVPAFRAAAFGVAAEFRPGLLRLLAHHPASVEDLCEALLSIPDTALGESLDVTLELARREPAQAQIVYRTAGLLAGRDPYAVDDQIGAMLDEVRSLREAASEYSAAQADQLIVQLLEPTTAVRKSFGDATLSAAISLVAGATPTGVRAIVRAHLVGGVAESRRQDLRDQVLRHKKANKMSGFALELIAAVPPWGSDQTAEPSLVLEFLFQGSKNSEQLRAAAVADVAERSTRVATGLLDELLRDVPTAHGRRLLICLQEAVKRAGGGRLVAGLASRPIPQSSGSLGRICGLLKTFSRSEPDLRGPLADWLAPGLSTSGAAAAGAYLSLTYDDPDRAALVVPHLAALADDERQRIIANLARDLSGAEMAGLEPIIGEAGSLAAATALTLRARLLGKTAGHDVAARTELVELIASPSELTAAQAIAQVRAIATAGEEWLQPEILQRYADFGGGTARLGALQITGILVRRSPAGTGAVAMAWLDAAHARWRSGVPVRSAEAVGTLELAHSYLRDGIGTDEPVIESIWRLVDYLSDPLPEDAAVRKSLFALAKTGLVHGDAGLRSRLGRRILQILSTVDLSTAADALSFSKEILGRVVEDGQISLSELVRGARTWPVASQILLVPVVERHDRDAAASLLLDEMLSWPPPAAAQQAIWKIRS